MLHRMHEKETYYALCNNVAFSVTQLEGVAKPTVTW